MGMTRRGFMGRLAVAAGVTALLPGVKAAPLTNVHIGANQVARLEDTFVTIKDMHLPVKWDWADIHTFDLMRKFDNGAKETDAEFAKRHQKFLGEIEFEQAVTGNAVARITGRKA